MKKKHTYQSADVEAIDVAALLKLRSEKLDVQVVLEPTGTYGDSVKHQYAGFASFASETIALAAIVLLRKQEIASYRGTPISQSDRIGRLFQPPSGVGVIVSTIDWLMDDGGQTKDTCLHVGAISGNAASGAA